MAYTLAQLRTEVYEMSGEISDLDPTGDTTRLDQAINEGQRRVAFYKNPRGRRVRFRQLMGQLNFQTTTITGTVVAGSSTTVTLDTSAGAEDDRYNDWLVKVGSEVHLIASYSSSRVATIVGTWGTTPTTSDTYTLYKRFERLLPSTHSWANEHITLPTTPSLNDLSEGNLLDVMKIVDLKDENEIQHALRGEFHSSEVEATGPPQEWYRFGNTIKFDRALDEARWFRLEYYRSPLDLSAAGDLPEIPESFHWGIVLWAKWWSHQRQQETQMASQAEADFNAFMNNTITPSEAASERDTGPRLRILPSALRRRR